MAKRQKFDYSEEFLRLGFTSIVTNNEIRPQCVLCMEVLAHSSLKTAKLRRHLETKHSNHATESLEYFKSKEFQIKRSRIDRPPALGGTAFSYEKATRASFVASWLIAKNKMPHTVGENLVKPVTIEMAQIMCGDTIANKFRMVPLSNDTVRRSENIAFTHCFLHRENLAAKHMQENLEEVFREVIVVVNFIKARALNSQLFEFLCKKMGSSYSHLRFFSNVRWLSRGKVLSRVAALRKETAIFLRDQNHHLADRFENETWIAKVLYMADIFNHLNQLNSSTQGRGKIQLDVMEDIEAFKGKICLWRNRMERGRIASFPDLNEFLESSVIQLSDISPVFIEHLTALEQEMNKYIPSDRKLLEKYKWVRNPFAASALVADTDDVEGLAEELIEMQNSQLLKDQFSGMTISQFWAQLSSQNVYRTLCTEATKVLLPFPTSYLCEAAFSVLAMMMKTKHRNQLRPEHDLRCALSVIEPNFDELVRSCQHQCSH